METETSVAAATKSRCRSFAVSLMILTYCLCSNLLVVINTEAWKNTTLLNLNLGTISPYVFVGAFVTFDFLFLPSPVCSNLWFSVQILFSVLQTLYIFDIWLNVINWRPWLVLSGGAENTTDLQIFLWLRIIIRWMIQGALVTKRLPWCWMWIQSL